MKTPAEHGFTLIELIIVIAILFILIVGLVAAFASFTKGHALSGAAESALSLLEKARSQTLASIGDTQYGARFDASSMTLFAGSYSGGAPGNVVFPYDSRVTMSNISLSGAGSEVIFKRLSGATDQSGTITFSLPNSPTVPAKVIMVSNSGLVELH